jgi:hypothetical protein
MPSFYYGCPLPLLAPASATIAAIPGISSTPIAPVTRITVVVIVMAHISCGPVAAVVAFRLRIACMPEMGSVMYTILVWMIGIMGIARPGNQA